MNTQKQPKALVLLSFVQLCRFFSMFGVRVLLVLFLVESLHYTDSHAFGMTAVFSAVAALMGTFGGIIADKFLGLRRSVTIGGWLLAGGYGFLLFENGLFPALGLLSLGSALFSTNISALLGAAYQENDPRRKKGFTIFYVIQNIGALISTLLCGWVASHFGFRAGFLVAGSGMLAANVALFFGRSLLPAENRPQMDKKALYLLPLFLLIPALGLAAAHFEEYFLPILPWISGIALGLFSLKLLKDASLDQKQVRKLLIYVGAMILFCAAEEQISSSLMLFSERMAERSIFGLELPSSIIMSVNPIVVILFGLLVARFRLLLVTPFVLAALSFGLLSLLCFLFSTISLFNVIAMVALLSLGELMIVPLLSSTASEVASKGKSGMMMGIIPIAGSVSSLLAGSFSKLVSSDAHISAFASYGFGFGKIALITLCGGFALQLLLSHLQTISKQTRQTN